MQQSVYMGSSMMDSDSELLRDLLTDYDREVKQTLRDLLTSDHTIERVQLLDKLRGAISLHDSEVESVLCPLLDDLPGGSTVADRLRRGCEERNTLLIRFGQLANGVAAHNVFIASGYEIEQIIDGLTRSLRQHESDTGEVVLFLTSSGNSDPEPVSTRMARVARHAPSRGHEATIKHPTSVPLRYLYHYLDKFHDWSDTHNGWIR